MTYFSRHVVVYATWVLILIACSCGNRINAEPAVFRAGAATSNITPPLGELIVGGWVPIPATNIHDELHARCLVMSDGTTTLAIVLCDNVGIPREVFDRAKTFIEAETGIPASHVLTAATHTHSATTARVTNKMEPIREFTDYQKFLARRIADGVRRAIQHLEPAEIAFGSIDEPSEIFNRRWFVTDPEMLKNPFGGVDQVRMNPPRANAALVRPAGPIDPEISFLSLRAQSGRPIALLANYSLHYVGHVNKGDVSADYFGYFCRRIEELLDAEKQQPPFVGILSNGTSGDCNNINFLAKSPRKQPYQKMREVADLVAQRVYAAHHAVTFRSDITLAAAQTDLRLKVRKPTPDMLAYFDQLESKPKTGQRFHYHPREQSYVRRVRALVQAPDEVHVPLQVFRIGEIGIAAIPFETFAETGLEIKDRSPLNKTFTIELANGSYGYLPTPPQHELGGYETWLGTNYVEKQASVKIVDRLMSLFMEVKDP